MRHAEAGIVELIRSIRKRSPLQLNDVHESDAELLQLGDDVLACTVDTAQEELDLGLFRTPAAQGWLAAVCSISDLAAVGARPLGLLLSCSVPSGGDRQKYKALFQGVEDCLSVHNTYLLGGDTNCGDKLSLSSTGIGLVGHGSYFKRNTFNMGDGIFFCGCLGLGNLAAFANLSGHPAAPTIEEAWRPVIRFDFMDSIRSHITACIDTSDGLFSTAQVLADFGCGGIRFDRETLVFPGILSSLAKEADIPELAFCFGEVGEYGLLFTAPRTAWDEIAGKAEEFRTNCRRVGEIVQQNGLFLRTGTKILPLNLEKAMRSVEGLPPEMYLKKLISLAAACSA